MTARRGSMRHTVRLACPPERIWELVGDASRLPEWWEGIDSCTVEGDTRTIVTRSGLPMPPLLPGRSAPRWLAATLQFIGTVAVAIWLVSALPYLLLFSLVLALLLIVSIVASAAFGPAPIATPAAVRMRTSFAPS